MIYHYKNASISFLSTLLKCYVCVVLRRLLSELEAFKSPSDKGVSKDGSQSAGDCVTYQLYYKPEQAKFTHNARVRQILILAHIPNTSI